MRVLFIIAVAVLATWFGGCAGGKAYIDLRKPIYLVTEDSFFTGCEKDPAGPGACRDSRNQIVRDGVMQWLDHFENDSRPFVSIVSSSNFVPFDTANQPIRVRVNSSGCDGVSKKIVLACYFAGNFLSEPHINFVTAAPDHIAVNVMAHEFGHALGLDHYDNQDKSPAIMSEEVPNGGIVVSTDIDRLCRIHQECPVRKGAGKRGKAKK